MMFDQNSAWKGANVRLQQIQFYWKFNFIVQVWANKEVRRNTKPDAVTHMAHSHQGPYTALYLVGGQ